jgi:RNA polymerase sigma-70 factor (ECF subfamily)
MVIDNELLKDCEKGKRRACNQLYEHLFSYLMNICIRYNNSYDEAGAALNAIFLKVVSNLSKRNPEKQLLPWVKVIAMNHLADEFRKLETLKNNMSFSDDLTQFDTLKSEFNVQINLEVKDLLKMIQKLPPACNKVFNLHAIDGYNHAEIGEMLGINEGTSKSQLHVARIKLQKMIEEEQKNLKVKQLEKAG